jgi:hypothetical protein
MVRTGVKGLEDQASEYEREISMACGSLGMRRSIDKINNQVERKQLSII